VNRGTEGVSLLTVPDELTGRHPVAYSSFAASHRFRSWPAVSRAEPGSRAGLSSATRGERQPRRPGRRPWRDRL